MFLVGLTGGIATGKSTISSIFKEHGIPVIDADMIARKVVEPNRKAWRELKKAFGQQIFHEDETLNREALAEIIFNSPSNRRKLNEITHPEIYNEILMSIVKTIFQGHQFVLLDLPLLFETEYMLDYIHKIIVVTCDQDLQLQRVMERYNIDESKAKKRIESQMSLESKCEKANFVVENSGALNNTRQQVERIITTLQASKQHWKNRLLIALAICVILFILIFVGYYLIC